MAVIGNLKDISLTNLVQVNGQSGMTGRLSIVHKEDNANIYFVSGKIVHATLGTYSGKEAFYGMLEWKDGNFKIETDIIAETQTISVSWSDLLVSGLQKLDERKSKVEISGKPDQTIPDDIGKLFGLDKLDGSLMPTEKNKEDDMANQLQEILRELGTEISGFISASIVGMDGLGIATYSVEKVNEEVTTAQIAVMFKAAALTIEELSGEKVVDSLLTTDKAYLMIRYLNDRDYFLSISCNRNQSNLGLVRLVSRTYIGRLSNAMPH